MARPGDFFVSAAEKTALNHKMQSNHTGHTAKGGVPRAFLAAGLIRHSFLRRAHTLGVGKGVRLCGR